MFDAETDAPPHLTDDAFDRVREQLAAGPDAACDRLIDELRAAGDFDGYFYALIMKARLRLGMSPFPSGPGSEVPDSLAEPYEDAIRDAARAAGRLHLGTHDIPRAWVYFRMIDEPGPVRDAVEAFDADVDDEELAEGVIHVAFQEGVHPERGFRLILDRFGICSAITRLGGIDPGQHKDVFVACTKMVAAALYEQLAERLRADIAERDGSDPGDRPVAELIAGRDWLFEDDAYHTDVSHLSSAVQAAMQLPPCGELKLARELCEYGGRLSDAFRGDGQPPFEDIYRDGAVYLSVLDGDDSEAGLEHFRAKVAPAAEEGDTYPAEILIGLLLRADRAGEALEVGRQYLTDADESELTCPGLYELCRRAGDHAALAEVARSRGEGVPFLASLIAAGRP